MNLCFFKREDYQAYLGWMQEASARYNCKVGVWVSSQRNNYKKGKLELKRVQRLEEIGFDWDPIVTAWEEKYFELKAFKKAQGHCNVPYNYKENMQLVTWIRRQQIMFNKGKLDADRIRRLEEIGFGWNHSKKGK